jgi:hypothetical protein
MEKAGSERNESNWQHLTNKEWPQLYATDHVPGFSDLQLIVDKVSFEIRVNQNWTYSLFTPANQTCDWRPASKQNKTFDLVVEFSTTQLNSIVPQAQSRLIASIEELAGSPVEYPELVWPTVLENRTWTICPGTGWLQYHSAFHVLRARAKVNGLANRVQVAIPFLSVVIASNIVKVIGIYLTIKAYSVDQMLTGGDAVASFLTCPEPATVGRCTLTKSQRRKGGKNSGARPWIVKKKLTLFVLGGARIWTATSM